MRPTGLLERIAEKRSIPGVLSFTASMQLLYMNSVAEELCQELLRTRLAKGETLKGNGGTLEGNGDHSNGVLPCEVEELCQALQKEMGTHVDATDGDGVQLRRVIGEANFAVLLRGFLIPGPEDDQETRFLILMEKLGRRTQVPTREAKRHFHLTNREHEIVKHVADGRTNKEIAEALEISEHTVKEHIKHILRKTNSATRTGILAQVLRYS